jgi:superfamily II DNA or RNA helicase
VLVHTVDLARQWIERLALLDGASVGLVGAGKHEGGARIVVAIVQSLIKRPWWERYDALRDFGLVIVDEAHHTPCASLLGILSSAPGRYRLGLTATPTRQDGLQEWIEWGLGPVCDRITVGELEAEGATLRPTIERVHTGWCPDEFDEWHEVGQQIVEADERNAQIAGQTVKLLLDGRQVLVLTERVEHCHTLAQMIPDAQAITGELGDREREHAIEGLRSGSLRCAVATQLADEGLDVPGLGAVVLAWPSRNLGAVQQRIGRACRPGEAKRPPVVVDLRDDHGVFKGYAKSRDRLYRELGW